MKLTDIRLDGGTQARVAMSKEIIEQYADAMREGVHFPPVTVFNDGINHWLADGFHRYHATQSIGEQEIPVTILSGTQADAQLFAYGANAKRGMNTSAEDNRSIIKKMLNHPTSRSWTLSQIAHHVGVSSMTVSRIKSSLVEAKEIRQTDEKKKYERNGKTVEVDTTNLGRKPNERQEVQHSSPDVRELLDTISELQSEIERLQDIISLQKWDASEIEKLDAEETIKSLREELRLLQIDNASLKESRDMYQHRNAELIAKVKSLQSKSKRNGDDN